MTGLLRPSTWPLAAKVPIAVGLFMIAVSAVFTNEVLRRLTETQERHLGVVAQVYLDGLSSAILPAVLRDDTWEVFDALDRFAATGAGFGKVTTLVANADGVVIAASDPRDVRVQSNAPDEIAGRFEARGDLVVDSRARRADARRALVYQGRSVGVIYAEIDIAELLKERQSVLLALLLTNATLALLLGSAGYFVVRRMVAPLRVLTAHLDRSVLGPVHPVPEASLGRADSEFGRLFRRFNTLASAVNEREVLANQLAQEERLSSLGRLASGMAHEINNPLGGLFNALNTLRQHGGAPSVRERALALLERGLSHIRDVVRATLVTYRAEAPPRALRPADLDDLRLLVEPEARRKNVRLHWDNHIEGELGVAAGTVCQAVLNLLLNACAAAPAASTVRLCAKNDEGWLRIAVEDEGAGLDPKLVKFLETAPPSASPAGNGLGLWIVRRLILERDGSISVRRDEGRTSILCELPMAGARTTTHEAATLAQTSTAQLEEAGDVR